MQRLVPVSGSLWANIGRVQLQGAASCGPGFFRINRRMGFTGPPPPRCPMDCPMGTPTPLVYAGSGPYI
jgi:hypothetical protein